MKKIILVLIFSLHSFFNLAYAEVIEKYEINGNDRISRETIILFSETKIKDNLDDGDLNEVLKKLYNTNFFKNVDVYISDGVLKISVFENPIIQSIKIEGIKSDDVVEGILDIMSLKDKNSYVDIFAKEDIKRVTNALKNTGYYFVDVKTSIKENDNSTIDLIYNIDLGKKAYIKKIKFIGNKIYKNKKLRTVIASEESKFWKFISKNKFLDINRISLDEKLLKNFYLNKGYYNVVVKNSFAQVINDDFFELSFNIDAGEKFYFNNLSLTLPKDYDKNNFKNITKIFSELKNEIYSFKKLEKILDEIDLIALQKQYEFINADVEEVIVNENKINLNFNIKETKKLYVERINIFGNNVTEEKVVRDNLIVDEGDAYNEILQTKSINKLKGLGIFKSVNSNITDGSTDNTKVINIEVVERPTGEISLGAGVGTTGGTIGFSIKENNYLGRNIKLNSNLQLTADSIRGLFSVTNPNFNYSGRALTSIIESSKIDKTKDFGYETARTGLTFATRFEQYDDFYISPSVDTYFETLETTSTASASYKKQRGNYFDTNFSYGLDLDKRDQKYQPTGGYRSTFNQSLPIYSDTPSLLNTYVFTKYNDFENITTSLSFFGNTINSLSDDDVRISKRVFMPERRLRGFEAGKIGPVDNNDFIGGNYASSINFVANFPKILPTFQEIEFNYFIDAANVWGVDYSDTIASSNEIRSSTGIALNWFTPIGPLNFSLAQALTKASTDKTETFRFNIGTTF